jgi:hypothetical protein
VIELLRKHPEGLTLEEITDLAQPFIHSNGYFIDCLLGEPTGKLRCLAYLNLKELDNLVQYNEETKKYTVRNVRNCNWKEAAKQYPGLSR